jgi:hypothetical protein
MGPARRLLLPALLALLASCSAAGSSPIAAPTSPATPTTTSAADRLPPDASAALARLASLSGPIDPTTTHDEPVTFATTLPPEEQARFDVQVRAAVDAARRFPTTDAAAAAGYVQSSTQLPGIGTHWVNWTLVDQPFDPARPAMLLFDQSPLHDTRLAGFSYWVRSVDPPEGFAGPNDVWHRHSGLCFVNGWDVRENVPAASDCEGQWLNGSDLWMLHVWVAPGVPNPDGLFAPRNLALCPADNAPVPDVVKCSAPGSPPLKGTHGSDTPLVSDASAYCHLPT